ncbi:MAG: translation elongation factor Ts, partial [Bacteroidales bacterium]|nr:translation elongation factor Ts [Bacteroidales bacterium]
KVGDGFAAIIALKCETDFVANGADYIKLTQEIIDAAVAAKAKSIDEVNKLTLANGMSVADAVIERSGVTGEKMELDGYNYLEGENIEAYNHMNRNGLCTLVQTNKPAAEQAHIVAMQVAAMNPLALDEKSVSQATIDEEIAVAVEKTKQEQVQKAVENALKKAGINPAHVDSEAHMESNMSKGWITAEDVAKAKEIIATVSAEKAANLPEAMIQNIAQGRLKKFFKESCLLNQEFIQDSKMTVAQYLQAADKELTVVAFKRFTLQAD